MPWTRDFGARVKRSFHLLNSEGRHRSLELFHRRSRSPLAGGGVCASKGEEGFLPRVGRVSGRMATIDDRTIL